MPELERQGADVVDVIERVKAKLKQIAEAVQVRAVEWTPYVQLGEWRLVSAARRNVTGFIPAGPTVFWNVEKK